MVAILFFICIMMHSQAATLVRFASAPSLAICFWRLLFAAVLLAPFAMRTSRLRMLRALSRWDLGQLLLSGFFLFTHFYFFFRSVQETTVANATILLCLSPVLIAIGAYWFFSERVTFHLFLACALGLAGVMVLFGESAFSSGDGALGNIWGVFSAACYSGYILTGKQVRKNLANSLYSFAIYLQTAVYAMIAMWIWQIPFLTYPTQSWISFAALAFFPTLLGHSIFTYCLNHMNVNFMSCMTLVEPVVAAACARWLFNEPLSQFAAIGFILTAASVVVLYLETIRGLFRRSFRKASP